MAPQKLSAKEAAIQLGTNARTLRKFLRSKQSPIEPVGQGNRYEFDTADMKKMKKSFVAWSNGSTTKPKPKKIEDLTTDEKEQYALHLAEVEEGAHPIYDEVDLDNEDIDLSDLDGPDEDDLLDIELEIEDDEIE